MRSPWRRRGGRLSLRRAGDLARSKRDWPAAEAHYRAHLEAYPEDQPIWVQLGHTLKEQGQVEAARAVYRQALSLRPDDPDAQAHLRGLVDVRPTRSDGRPLLLELGQLLAGEQLSADTALRSRDGRHALQLSADGALRLTAADGRLDAPPLWASDGAAGSGARLVMRPQGELAVETALGDVLWTTGRVAPPGARLELTDGGRIELTDGRDVFWARPEAGPERDAARPIDASRVLELDAPGGLSVVVQGGLFHANAVQTATHLEHWRALFPAAEIVLAISGSDLIAETRPGELAELSPVPRHAHDGMIRAALEAIRRCADAVVLARGALPLPRFKEDSGPNNFNLQLAAAQAGLERATGRRVLRIRSDAVFLDRRFADQHLEDAELPRGAEARFAERVMISSLFTLNPFTIERMPLHFSDWFHFGLLEDVRRIWRAPPIPLVDALHYRSHPHARGSNLQERKFVIRRAVEQHLALHCFHEDDDPVVLDHHNDPTSTDRSLRLLADNFVLCDLSRCGFVFDKYLEAQRAPENQVLCLTRADLRRLALNPHEAPRAVLEAPIAALARNPERFGLSADEGRPSEPPAGGSGPSTASPGLRTPADSGARRWAPQAPRKNGLATGAAAPASEAEPRGAVTARPASELL